MIEEDNWPMDTLSKGENSITTQGASESLPLKSTESTAPRIARFMDG